MKFRLSNKARSKLPIGEDQVPLKTKENLEEYLQSAISFLQTQEMVLQKILEILEGNIFIGTFYESRCNS